ncbi:hypothetical protein ACFSLT_03205 [Novosphingobium resinovorum]
MSDINWNVYQPAQPENPVVSALKELGLYKKPLSHGKHDVSCPWAGEHTDALDTGAAYFEPNDAHSIGGFKCQHSHGDRYRLPHLLEHLGLTIENARNKPTINLVPGELHGVVSAAEAVLATQDDIYVAGGHIVRAAYDPSIKDTALKPLSEAELTLILSRRLTGNDEIASRERWNGLIHRHAPFSHCTAASNSLAFAPCRALLVNLTTAKQMARLS